MQDFCENYFASKSIIKGALSRLQKDKLNY